MCSQFVPRRVIEPGDICVVRFHTSTVSNIKDYLFIDNLFEKEEALLVCK